MLYLSISVWFGSSTEQERPRRNNSSAHHPVWSTRRNFSSPHLLWFNKTLVVRLTFNNFFPAFKSQILLAVCSVKLSCLKLWDCSYDSIVLSVRWEWPLSQTSLPVVCRSIRAGALLQYVECCSVLHLASVQSSYWPISCCWSCSVSPLTHLKLFPPGSHGFACIMFLHDVLILNVFSS